MEDTRGLDADVPDGDGLPEVVAEEQGERVNAGWHLIAPFSMRQSASFNGAIWPGNADKEAFGVMVSLRVVKLKIKNYNPERERCWIAEVSYSSLKRDELVAGLHRNSAYLERRAALASLSATSGATDN